jgi:hypothetical protein
MISLRTATSPLLELILGSSTCADIVLDLLLLMIVLLSYRFGTLLARKDLEELLSHIIKEHRL